MKHLGLYTCIAFIFSACLNNTNRKIALKDSAFNKKIEGYNDSNSTIKSMPSDSVPDFLSFKMKERSFGIFQNIDRTDSAGPYVHWKYYSDTLSFELIFYPKNISKKLVEFSSFERKYGQNNYVDFNCFAFVYPMIDPEKDGDYHADNTPYPVTVKAYFRKNGLWNFVSSREVKNMTELSKYRVDVMYSNLK